MALVLEFWCSRSGETAPFWCCSLADIAAPATVSLRQKLKILPSKIKEKLAFIGKSSYSRSLIGPFLCNVDSKSSQYDWSKKHCPDRLVWNC